jgi:rhodanese-related sulfurtransferase
VVSLDQVLARARSRLDRIAPADLATEVKAGALVVDVRDTAIRSVEGELPGAHAVDLTVLEWRLAPSSATRVFEISPGQKVILVCSDGYSSSLAAGRLLDLGVAGATDLIGGYRAWRALREPTDPSSRDRASPGR